MISHLIKHFLPPDPFWENDQKLKIDYLVNQNEKRENKTHKTQTSVHQSGTKVTHAPTASYIDSCTDADVCMHDARAALLSLSSLWYMV